MVLAKAARRLLDQGQELHVLAIGDGEERAAMQALLGSHVTLPGNLDQSELGWIYASSDIFVFPSETEVSPNVVLEAKASGLPVVVAADHGGGQFIAESGRDGVIVAGQDPARWARAAESRRWAETSWPSWLDVLREDLLPVWRAAAAEQRG
jgi:glycosyltransferase involved in cell wall biosynthesis